MSRQSETARRIHLDALANERRGIEQRVELADDAGDKARLNGRLQAIDEEAARLGGAGIERATRGRNRETRA